MSMFADTHGFVEYDDRAHKYLSANRDRYIDQSRRTRNGVVAQPYGSAGSAADRGGESTGPVVGASTPTPGAVPPPQPIPNGAVPGNYTNTPEQSGKGIAA